MAFLDGDDVGDRGDDVGDRDGVVAAAVRRQRGCSPTLGGTRTWWNWQTRRV
jgi:hypothetical protein